MTLEETWCGRRPNISYFKIFGCIAYTHILNEKRKKLDDKGEKYVFLGVSDCLKAYKLYNPNTKKIIISCDVIFDEKKFWKWSTNGAPIPTNFDGEKDEEKRHPVENQQESTIIRA